ncbi:MAG TPA: response regulator transcription factor [Candidatus Acidoferrum sp.]|nr:response regulator transcription factor [Candidatus Acidoferrum sp.]
MIHTSIVLADDHHIVRQGLRSLLETEEGFAVVGETGDGLKVVDLVEQLRPDVLVLDLMMPGLNGMEVTRQVAQRCPKTKVIILSMHANEAYVMEALRNGAVGYVLKDASTSEVVAAVREVTAGRHYLSRPLSERAIETYAQKAQAAPLDMSETLTSREREILQLAAESYSSTEIAARLGISPRTAETHRANLMRKLSLQSQTDLIRYAIRRGLLSVE